MLTIDLQFRPWEERYGQEVVVLSYMLSDDCPLLADRVKGILSPLKDLHLRSIPFLLDDNLEALISLCPQLSSMTYRVSYY